jgi:2-polyprenyl-3-methyl-5-hydroxy-6-metoxy-1,4-benzoquinol methylase
MKAEAYQIMEDCEESYWWYRARREIIAETVRRFVPRGANLLDFGCGHGATAERLARSGYRVVVTDLAESARARCLQRRLEVFEPDDIEEKRGAGFDGVLACDVLEHVEDEATLLLRLCHLLRPGGHLLVTVPACEFLWSGEDYVSEHVRRYNGRGLVSALRSAGLDLVWRSHFNTLLFPAVASAIVWKRLVRPREMYRSNVQPLPRWLDDTLGRIFSMERPALRYLRFPIGTSIIAVARRPVRSAARTGPGGCESFPLEETAPWHRDRADSSGHPR